MQKVSAKFFTPPNQTHGDEKLSCSKESQMVFCQEMVLIMGLIGSLNMGWPGQWGASTAWLVVCTLAGSFENVKSSISRQPGSTHEVRSTRLSKHTVSIHVPRDATNRLLHKQTWWRCMLRAWLTEAWFRCASLAQRRNEPIRPYLYLTINFMFLGYYK